MDRICQTCGATTYPEPEVPNTLHEQHLEIERALARHREDEVLDEFDPDDIVEFPDAIEVPDACD